MSRDFRSALLNSVALVVSVACVASPAFGQARNAEVLDQIDVIGVSPLSSAGTGVDRAKIPAMAQSVKSTDVERTGSQSVIDTLSRTVPGIQLSDVQGNAFSQDLSYRGFYASPLQGVAQGLAVYQNGVRVNEGFGDTVNWDFIPPNAISRIDVWTNNPLFGLNAIGGAINMQMKNGFTYQGGEAEVKFGSYGRIGGSFQYGMEKDNFGFYIATDAMRDAGWRKHSASQLFRLYSDFGWRNNGNEIHVIASGATNKLGVVGPTPVEALRSDYASVYTWPQTTNNENMSLAVNGSFNVSPTWTVLTNAYVRRFLQSHVDGNDSDLEKCSNSSSFGTQLCLEDDAWGTPVGGKTKAWRDQFVMVGPDGKTIPFAGAAVPYGIIDRTWSRTTTIGASVAATNTEKLNGNDNHFTVGASIDHSWISFQSTSTLGYIFPDLRVGTDAAVPGLGTVLRTAGNLGFAPVNLSAENNYVGAYAIDTYNITPNLALTAGVRLNIADIKTNDRSGTAPELNGSHQFIRVNPMIGLAYKLPGDTTVYAGYSEANRAPTPLELNCADPVRPCLLENSLVADPPLKQVVARTFEAGLRGTIQLGAGSLDWKFAAFRTDLQNDIISVASVLQGRGYYTNVPGTRRQGVELGLQYSTEVWSAYFNYAYVDATYRFNGTLASPNNPFANATGDIIVRSGNTMPGIPAHQLKVGAEYSITPQWKIGADISAFSSQYLRGDDGNQNPQLPAYAVVGLRTSYQATKNVQIFAQVNNLFNRKFGVFGTYFDTAGSAKAIATPYTNPTMQTPLQPFSVYGGMKVTF